MKKRLINSSNIGNFLITFIIAMIFMFLIMWSLNILFELFITDLGADYNFFTIPLHTIIRILYEWWILDLIVSIIFGFILSLFSVGSDWIDIFSI